MNFDKSNTDDVEESGFINKDKILEYVTEEDIFELVFDFKPVEFDYVVSPFREDVNPGCWFEYAPNSGKLRFTDFGDNRVIRGVKMKNIDCFDAVMVHFNLSNFYRTLDFIKNKLIDGKNIKNDIVKKHVVRRKLEKKKKVEILVKTRTFNNKDRAFWFLRYGMTKIDLIKDGVFPIQSFKLTNTKSGDHFFNTQDASYVYTEFVSGKKKIYRPFKKGSKRFVTNCGANDIGGMRSSVKAGRLLLITKSYKDYGVLKSFGLNVRWLQNESVTPDSDEFWNLIQSFDKIIVFYDNDNAGITGAKKLQDYINFKYPNKSSYVHLPENLNPLGISDPSDLVHKKNKEELVKFLKSNKILL